MVFFSTRVFLWILRNFEERPLQSTSGRVLLQISIIIYQLLDFLGMEYYILSQTETVVSTYSLFENSSFLNPELVRNVETFVWIMVI